jgi:hypothetical protein
MHPRRRQRPDPFSKDVSIRGLLLLGLLLQLLMMAAGLWPAAWLVMRFASSATSPGYWVLIMLGALLAFNYGYLLALLAVRIITPYPKEGSYTVEAGKRPPKQVVVFMANVLLLKARMEPPWAPMFSSVLSRVFPLRPLFNHFFGPRTQTTPPGDTIYLLDPHLTEIGKNVQLGFHCTIAAHLFNNRKLIIRKVVIEDHAVIGGEAGIQPGVHVGRHAVVAGRAHVMAGTVIGPYEYWAGDPARKVKTLSGGESRADAEGEPAAERISAEART